MKTWLLILFVFLKVACVFGPASLAIMFYFGRFPRWVWFLPLSMSLFVGADWIAIGFAGGSRGGATQTLARLSAWTYWLGHGALALGSLVTFVLVLRRHNGSRR